ncbi:MAG: hypothetical protein HY075_15655, partial [Deltaproteobacteria bacterium]|nr:hypothetical protein [Deltaproteobacteria bacterium]
MVHGSTLRLLAAVVAFAGAAAGGCSHVVPQVTKYDSATEQHLNDLKPAVLSLYDTFTADPVDAGAVDGVRQKIAQACDYEAGKGDD